ncbi:merozoite surface protein 1 paralog, putative [Plasmodium malariae]|uniref:Merozoite surface protein 1 paralog, putative n=1 Tax=Plasmodium malariae TaxID=5858 RepID=A0A1C3KBY1_PLAMA|nr:merozoite surface protein 1 paralog, putative [Plasmodium malariae]
MAKEYALTLISLTEQRETIRASKKDKDKLKQVEEDIKETKKKLNDMYFAIKHVYSSVNLKFAKELYLFENEIHVNIFEEKELGNVKTIMELKKYLEKMTRYYKKTFMKNKLVESCTYINNKNILRKQIEILKYTYKLVLIKLYYRDYVKFFKKLIINTEKDLFYFYIPFNALLNFKEDIYYMTYENYGANITTKKELHNEKDAPDGKNGYEKTQAQIEEGNNIKNTPNCEHYSDLVGAKCSHAFSKNIITFMNNIDVSLEKNIDHSIKELRKKMIQIAEKQNGVNSCRDVIKELKYKSYDKISFDQGKSFEEFMKNDKEKKVHTFIEDEKKKKKKDFYENKNIFEHFIFFHIEKILSVKRKLEDKLKEFLTTFNTFQNDNSHSIILQIGNEMKHIFILLSEYINLYSFIYSNMNSYYATVRELFSLNYFKEMSKENKEYIAENIVQKIGRLNMSLLTFKNEKNNYEQFIKNVKKKKKDTEIMHNSEKRKLSRNNEEQSKENRTSKSSHIRSGKKNVSKNCDEKDYPWFTQHIEEETYFSEEERKKKKELYDTLINKENKYLHNLKNIMKLLNNYKKQKNKKITVNNISYIDKVEREPIIFASKYRQYQIVQFYKTTLLFIKIAIIKRLLLRIKRKIQFLRKFSASAFLFNKHFLYNIYNNSYEALVNNYKKSINTNFCFDLILENLDGQMKHMDFSNVLIKYMIYIFSLNPKFMSNHLSNDNELILNELYKNISSLNNLNDTKIFLQKNHVSYKVSRGFLPEGKMHDSFRIVYSYLYNLFSNDDISGYILKNFEYWKSYHGGSNNDNYVSHIKDEDIYSRKKMKQFLFKDVNNMESEFNAINEETTISSNNFCSYLEFPLNLINNTFLMNSLSESYKYILYKTQQSQILKIYYHGKYKHLTVFEKLLLQVVSNYAMAPYNNLKIKMMNAFCLKKGSGAYAKSNGTIPIVGNRTIADGGLFSDSETASSEDIVKHKTGTIQNENYVHNSVITISCSEIKSYPTGGISTLPGAALKYDYSSDRITINNNLHYKVSEINSVSKESYMGKKFNNDTRSYESFMCDLSEGNKKKKKKNIFHFNIKVCSKCAINILPLELSEKTDTTVNLELYQFFVNGERGNSLEDVKKMDLIKEEKVCNDMHCSYFKNDPFVVHGNDKRMLIDAWQCKEIASQKEIFQEKESFEHYYLVLNLLYEYNLNKRENLSNIKNIEEEISSLYVKVKLYEENISYVISQKNMEKKKYPFFRVQEGENDMNRQYKKDVSIMVNEKYKFLLDIYKNILQLYTKSENDLMSLKRANEKKQVIMKLVELNKYALFMQNKTADLWKYIFYHQELLKYIQKQHNCCDAYMKEMKVHFEYLPRFYFSDSVQENKKILEYLYISVCNLYNDIIRCEKNTKIIMDSFKSVKDKLHLIYSVNANSYKKYRRAYLTKNYFYMDEEDKNIYFFTDKYENIKSFKTYEKLIHDIQDDLIVIRTIKEKIKSRQTMLEKMEEQIEILTSIFSEIKQKSVQDNNIIPNIHILHFSSSYENMQNYDCVQDFEKNLNNKNVIYTNILSDIRYSFEHNTNISEHNSASFFYNYVKCDHEKCKDAMKFVDEVLKFYERKNRLNSEEIKSSKNSSHIIIPYEKKKKKKKDDLFSDMHSSTVIDISQDKCNHISCPQNSFCFIKDYKEKCYCFLNYTMIGDNCYLNEQNSCAVNNGGCDIKAKCQLTNTNINCVCPTGTKSMHDGVLCNFSLYKLISNIIILFILIYIAS